MNNQSIKVLNPFLVTLNEQKRSNQNPFVTLSKEPKISYRDVEIFEIYSNHYVYVHNGVILTERQGATKDYAKTLIDCYFDGKDSNDYFDWAGQRMRDAMTKGEEFIKNN
jgi:hypothetical protein